MHVGVLDSNMSNDWVGSRTVDGETRRRLDEFLSVLADQRRRELLYHLSQAEVTDVETLVSKVARAEADRASEPVPGKVRDRVETNLVHVHLPKLADANAIEFDRRSEAIRCDELPGALERLLETCRDAELDGSSDD